MRIQACLAAAIIAFSASAHAEITPADKSAIDAFYGAFNSHDLSKLDQAIAADWDDNPFSPGRHPRRPRVAPRGDHVPQPGR